MNLIKLHPTPLPQTHTIEDVNYIRAIIHDNSLNCPTQ